jgi:hypothetical protein
MLHPELKKLKNPSAPASNEGPGNPKTASAYVAAAITCSSSIQGHSNSSVWLIDTGASQHMTMQRSWFSSFSELTHPTNVNFGDGLQLKAAGIGSIAVPTLVGGQQLTLQLLDVLYVPQISVNLISVAALDNDFKFVIKKGSISIYNTHNELIAIAHRSTSNLYHLIDVSAASSNKVSNSVISALVSQVSNMDLWHQRLGHLGVDNIRLMETQRLVEGLSISPKDSLDFCEGCVLGKQSRLPFLKSGSVRAGDLLELIHVDLNGPMSEPSLGGANYFMLVIDDHS